MKKIRLPLTEEEISGLKAGEGVLLSGTILTGRDCAHKRICEYLDRGEKLPFDFKGETIYYAGPCPAPAGKACGSCGPTTSARMDAFTPRLLSLGLKGMIGKGDRNDEVIAAMKEAGAVYFAATGGAGALISQCIKHCEVAAFDDLGPEAIYRMEVEDMPLVVAIDAEGNDLYRR